MGQVSLRGIRKSYGTVDVIKGVDLDVKDGEFMVFVGPSGCGKSTTLRMIAGLETVTAGDLLIDGVRANDLRPADRGAAMVFQSYALYPHMTVAENMGFALKMAGVSRASRDKQVQHSAEVLRITELLARYPKQLSGGQRQRVAIGRAIVRVHGVALPVPGEAIRLWKSPASPALYPQLIGSRLFLPRTKPSHSVLSCA